MSPAGPSLLLLVPPEFGLAWPWAAPDLERARALGRLTAAARVAGGDVHLRLCAGRTAAQEAQAAGGAAAVAVVVVPGSEAAAVVLLAALVAADVPLRGAAGLEVGAALAELGARVPSATDGGAAPFECAVSGLGLVLTDADDGASDVAGGGAGLAVFTSAPEGGGHTDASARSGSSSRGLQAQRQVLLRTGNGAYGVVAADVRRLLCGWPPPVPPSATDLCVVPASALAAIATDDLGGARLAVAPAPATDAEATDADLAAVAAAAPRLWPDARVAAAAAWRLRRSRVDLELQMFAGNALLARNRELTANIVP